MINPVEKRNNVRPVTAASNGKRMLAFAAPEPKQYAAADGDVTVDH
jgi:hypothetical protein